MLSKFMKEYEKLTEIEEAVTLDDVKKDIDNVNPGAYGPFTLVATTIIAMAAGVIVGSRVAKNT